MRHHRTVGPPSKPGHGRGSAPYGRSDSTSRPWGGASWTVEKQRASCKSRSWTRSWTLSNVAWLVNISWIAFVTSLLLALLPELWPRHRLNQPSSRIRRIGGITAKNHEFNACRREESLFCDVTRRNIHISRVSTREHPKTHEPTHVVSEDKDQSNAFEGNKTTSNLLLVNKQVPLTKSILLIELVESDLNAVTEH